VRVKGQLLAGSKNSPVMLSLFYQAHIEPWRDCVAIRALSGP
jgi:hypothetical protein